MKKIIFILSGVLISLYSMGQAPSSEVINAIMPKGSIQLTKEQLTAYTHNNYKLTQISGEKKNTYQLDGLLISFWDLSVNPEFKKSLKDSQTEILGYLRDNNENIINYSKIINVNNIEFLIYEYQKNDEVYLRFQSDYNKNNKNICGIVQFKKPDEDKAQAALHEFLESVHFK